MKIVLSYFASYFSPGRRAPLSNHSAGRIASALYENLSELGPVTYFDQSDAPKNVEADLYVGHFYTFSRFCRGNEFSKKVAFYSVSDPVRRRALLLARAGELGVPVPPWDFPPEDFDHAETMELADLVVLVGNEYTLQTFPERWHSKIRLLNYSVDRGVFDAGEPLPRGPEMVYVATSCGLRKGFMDVLRVWSRVPADAGTLHVVGGLEPPWDSLLDHYNTGSIRYHGWIDSCDPGYSAILRRSRHAHLPTYEEGQMGTALEAVFSGCLPITTLASGLDERVLAHGAVIDAMDVEQQRAVILEELARSDESCAESRTAMLAAAETHHSWEGFRKTVLSVAEEMLGG
jgi:glycosyltransferase involved in cell wall biosynthesis